MSSKRRTETIIETHEVWVVRRPGSTRWLCGQCTKEAEMFTPYEAARLRSVSQLTIYRWVESGDIHFTETPDGRLFVCLEPLLAGAR
jgi:excisionase family DNA binding protein